MRAERVVKSKDVVCYVVRKGAVDVAREKAWWLFALGSLVGAFWLLADDGPPLKPTLVRLWIRRCGFSSPLSLRSNYV